MGSPLLLLKYLVSSLLIFYMRPVAHFVIAMALALSKKLILTDVQLALMILITRFFAASPKKLLDMILWLATFTLERQPALWRWSIQIIVS